MKKILCVFVVLIILATVLVVPCSAYSYDDDFEIIVNFGNYGGSFGEVLLTPSGIPLGYGYGDYLYYSNTVASNVPYTYYREDIFNTIKSSFDIDPTLYYPIMFTSYVDPDNELGATFHMIFEMYVGYYDSDNTYVSAQCPFVNTQYGSFALVDDIDYGERIDLIPYADYYYGSINPQNEDFGSYTYCTLLVPIDSELFEKFCPYDFNGVIDYAYEEGFNSVNDTLASSPYGLIYNGIGELIYGDVDALTSSQELVLAFVSFVLCLIVILVPLLVLFWLFKVVIG